MECLFQDFFSAVIFLARHRKNREAASELLMRLKDNRDLQKFLQDCQEVNYLLSVVSLLAVSYRRASLPPHMFGIVNILQSSHPVVSSME